MESGTCYDRDGCTCEGKSIVYDSYCEISEQNETILDIKNCESTNERWRTLYN